MPQSYSRVILHTTYSTKYRNPLITAEIEEELLRYKVGVLKNMGSHVIRINAVEDHVHIIHTLPRTVCIAVLLQEVKGKSSTFVSERFEGYEEFSWQGGYATFSVDYRKLDGLIRYVENQKEHHKSDLPHHSFEHEYKMLLKAYGIEFNAKYLFPEDPYIQNAA